MRTGYLLAGFSDFESALAATGQLCSKGFRVAYLNEASHVRELEVRSFPRSFEAADECRYQNYHYARREQAKTGAKDSFHTALEVLEERNDFKPRFILVFSTRRKPAEVTVPGPAALSLCPD